MEDDLVDKGKRHKSLLETFMNAVFLVFTMKVALATYISVNSVTIIQSYEPDSFLYNMATILTPIFVPLLALNIVIIIVMVLIRKFVWIIVPCLAIAFNCHIIPNVIQVRKNPSRSLLADAITLQSNNVHRFSYDSFENTVDNILLSASINETDILCLQEYTAHKGEANVLEYATIEERVRIYKKQDEVLTKNGNRNSILEVFPHSCFSDESKRIGIAIFSVHPIVYSETYDFLDSDQEALIADIEVNNTIIRVITVHLHTTSISQHNDQIAILGLPMAGTSSKLNALSILTQAFRESSSIRRGQADIITNLVKESPHPVIVCGDFNDTSNSYSYHKLEELLSDAFKTVGRGYACSYLPLLRSLRIDYVFHSSEITPVQFYYRPYPWSDHSAAFFKFATLE